MTDFAQAPSRMSRAQFLTAFGALYEHSSWIAETVFDAGLTAAQDTREGLHRALSSTMLAAPRAQRLALIRAHPDLAGQAAVTDGLALASQQEQSGAGLDQCSEEEHERLQALNTAYKKKFGFPFVLAVKGLHRKAILEIFQQRVQNDPVGEFSAALEQINRIAWLRLEQL